MHDLSTLKLVVDGEQGTRALQKYDAAAQKADRSSRLLDEATSNLTKALGLLGGAAALLKITQIADQYTTLNARLGLSAKSATDLATAQQRLFAIAQNTRQPLADVVALYARLNISSGELGVSQERLTRFTDGINKALVVSGSNATQASGALQQLSQAIGGGIVRAEEFNSILDGAPRVLQAVAQGFEGGALSVAQLRTRVIEGQVSSKQFFEAFERGAKQIDAEFARIPTTISGALTQLTNVFGKLVSDTDKTTAGTALLVKGIQGLTTLLPALTTAAVAVGAAFGVRFLGNAIQQARDFTLGLAKSRAETVAYAEDAVRTAAAQRAASAQRIQQLQAEQVAIRAAAAAERERLATANARVARAVPVESLAVLGGRTAERDNAQVVFALKAQAEAQASLTALQTQGIAVNGALAAEKTALTAATVGVTAATTAQAAATSLAAKAAELGKAALAGLGGAMGLITFGVGLLLVKVMGDLAKAEQDAAEKLQKFNDAAKDLSNAGRVAALQTELELQQRLNAQIPRTVGGIEDQTKAETFAARIALQASAQRVKALRDIITAEGQLASKQAAAAPNKLATELDAARAKLEAYRRGGVLAAEATERANREWVDGTGKARTFAQALAQGDLAAKAQYESTLKIVSETAKFTRVTEAATAAENNRKETKEALKAMEEDYQADVILLGLELESRRQKAIEDTNTALLATDTALRQLTVAQTAKDAALKAEIAALNGGIGAGIEYARQQQVIAIATERMNDARAAGIPLTQQVIAGILADAAATQRLIEKRDTLKQIEGVNLSTLFAIPGSTTDSVKNLDTALQSVAGTLRDVSQALNGTGNDAVKMLGVLAGALDGLARAQKQAAEMAKAGVRMSGTQRVATALGGAVGAFGSGLAIGSMTTSRTAGAIGGALSGAATGASAGASIGSVTGPGAVLTAGIGAGIGALIGGIGGIIGASKNATQQLIAQRAAQQQLNEALASLRASFTNDALGSAIAQARAQFSQLRQQTEAAFAGRKNEAERGRILAELNTLEARRLELIRAEFAESQRRLQEDAKVRTLRANGFIAEADALAFSAEQERKLADLRKSGADAATIAAEQEALLAEARRRQAEIAEAERRTLFDLENGTRAFTDPRGASQAAFAEEQQRRYTDAVTRGASAVELAALTAFQFAEAMDRAAQIVEADTRVREGLVGRGLTALGNTRGAEDAILGASQRQEIADALREGMSPSNLALLQFVQFVEREQLAMRRAIEEGTARIKDAAEKQIAAIDEQIAAEEKRAASEIAAIDRQIGLIRDNVAMATAQFDGQISAIRDGLDAELSVIDGQLDALNAILDTQRSQLQAAESALQVSRAAYEALTEFGRSLGQTEGATSPLQRLADAEARFTALTAAARGGDAAAAGQLPEAARLFLDASRGFNASGTGFQRDFARVQAIVDELSGQFGGDAERLTAEVAAMQALVASTEQQISTLETLRETITEAAEAQIAIIQQQKDALVESAAIQIAKLEGQREQIRDASAAIVAALQAQKEAVRLDADRQIRELIKVQTEAFNTRIAASDYYRTWKEITESGQAATTSYQESSTSLWESMESQAAETAAELRAQTVSLKELVASQADQIAALQAQIRTTAEAGRQTVGELSLLRQEIAAGNAIARRNGEGLLA